MVKRRSQHSGELVWAIYDRAIDASRRPPSDMGKRRAPRIEADGTLKLVPVEGGLPIAEPVAVNLTEISSGGFGMTASHELTEDSRHLVTLRRDGQPPMWLECAVRHCAKVGSDKFAIGAQFIAMRGQFELSIWSIDVEPFASRAA